jgi:hypothetical protein
MLAAAPSTAASAASNLSDWLGRYSLALTVAIQNAPVRLGVIGCAWVLYPFLLKRVWSPSDALRLERWFHGEPTSVVFPWSALLISEISALIMLVCVSLSLLALMILFYRESRFVVSISPIAGLLTGFIGNGIWWVYTGYFDSVGAIIGLSPIAITIGCEAIIEKLAGDFVFGPGPRPRFQLLNLKPSIV